MRQYNKNYLNKLQKIANEKNKDVYAIFNDGAMIYNRENKGKSMFVRRYEEFMSEVDHVKYPNIKQKYRFEPTSI